MSDITKIREWIDSDEPEPEHGYDWPHPPICVESAISGDLRGRILAKLGRDDGVVTLIESEIEGGYSEFSSETDYTVEVMVDGEKVWQHDYAWTAENAIKAFTDWAR